MIDQSKLENSSYDLFIEGELVNLCIPNSSAIENDGWHTWFNRISDLQYTTHGIFPNTRENQELFLKNLDKKESIVLLVCTKTDNSAVGVVSLQDLDLTFRIGQDMFERTFFEEWQDRIIDHETHALNYYENYVRDIYIAQLGPDDSVVFKILVNKEGKIEDTFSSFTKPLSNKIINKIENIL